MKFRIIFNRHPLVFPIFQLATTQTMKHYLIREATAADYDTLLRFEQGVISAERPFDPTLKDDPIRYYDINEMITAPHIHLVVADNGNELMGCGYARIENAKPYLRHRKHAYVGFMYTEQKYRGQGVNARIVDALKEWSLLKDILEMRLEVYCDNAPALKAYKKAGFTSHMIEMRMALASGE